MAIRSARFKASLAGLVILVLLAASACGSDEPAPAAAPAAAPAIDTAALRSLVEDAVKSAAPAASGVTAAEIRTLVEAAVVAASPEGATPEQIRAMIQEGVASVETGASRAEIESLISKAVADTAASQTPGVSASEVQKIVSEAIAGILIAPPVVVQKVVLATPTVFEAIKIDQATDGRYGGTFKTVSQASIATLDPISSSTWVTWAVAIQIYDALFASAGDFQVQPQMVDKWSISNDALVWTFENREGLLFHDGSPVTAGDVKATLERAFGSFYTGWKELDKRATVGVVDDRTWTISLEEPFGLMFDALNFNTEGFPVQKASVIEGSPAGRAEAVLQEHIGSGPYKFISWDVGNRVVLERFEDYRRRSEAPSGHAGAKFAFVDRIEFLEIPDVQTRLSLLETREVDFIDTAPLDFFEIMQANRDINVYTDPIGRWPVIALNHHRPPFNDVKARQALLAAIDNDAIMAAYGPPALRGLCPAIFLCGLRWDTRVGEENYNQNDIPKAQRLLSESSYDGRPVVAMTPVDQPTIHPILTVAESNIRAAGFNLDLQFVDWATLKTRRAMPDDWDIFTTWGASAQSSPLTNNLGIGSLLGFQSERISKLKEDFFRATSEEEQKRLVDEMQLAWYEEVPLINIGFFSGIHAAGVWVRGFDPRALWPAYWNVWLER